MDVGINFRATSGGGGVTDGSNETYCLGPSASPTPESYPTTRGGATFGFESWNGPTPDCRDRNAGVDRRCAGINFIFNSTGDNAVFRFDVVVGACNIWLGAADYLNSQQQFLNLQDNTTQFQDLTNGGSGYATVSTGSDTSVLDASGVVRTSIANWAAAQASVAHTFVSSILRVGLNPGNSNFGNATTITHLRVQSVSAPAPVGLPSPPLQFARRASGRFR